MMVPSLLKGPTVGGSALGMSVDYLEGPPFLDFRTPGLFLAAVIGTAIDRGRGREARGLGIIVAGTPSMGSTSRPERRLSEGSDGGDGPSARFMGLRSRASEHEGSQLAADDQRCPGDGDHGDLEAILDLLSVRGVEAGDGPRCLRAASASPTRLVRAPRSTASVTM